MLPFAHLALTALTALVHAVDWIADRFEHDEELPDFLREEYRPIQWRGRPRKDVL